MEERIVIVLNKVEFNFITAVGIAISIPLLVKLDERSAIIGPIRYKEYVILANLLHHFCDKNLVNASAIGDSFKFRQTQ